jgi:pSer/pThr/pTyr-binding forkhead associated (FHA) protein
MPVIKVNDQQFALRPGPNRLGGGDAVDVPVAENPSLGVQAIVDVANNSQAVIRPAAGDSAVRINGMLLVDPTPLMHGDRLEIGGRELYFTDDSKSGATQYVSANEIAAMAAKRAGPARATAATGGRLVSLVDGKEYIIPSTGITMGRDAASGVVIAQTEVSRRHAEVAPIGTGYEIRDFSVNGVYVNGVRVTGTAVLSRADVIRIGKDEFRFYADVAPLRVGNPPKDAPPSRAGEASDAVAAHAAPNAPPAPAGATAPGTALRGPATVPIEIVTAPLAIAARPTDEGKALLALLEAVGEADGKRTLYEVRVPLAYIGRGTHNDVVINDASVSDAHARLQYRDDAWYLADIGSTNGTYVGGQRIAAEQELSDVSDLRFGAVKLVFRPQHGRTDSSAGGGEETTAPAPQVAAPVEPPAPQQTAPVAEPEPPSGLPGWMWGVVVLAIGAAAAFFLLNR